jgi:hypothetical protein
VPRPRVVGPMSGTEQVSRPQAGDREATGRRAGRQCGFLKKILKVDFNSLSPTISLKMNQKYFF